MMTAEKIAIAIENWDKNDITELLDLLRDYAVEIGDDDMAYEIDMSNLPSADIPADIDTGYPVWALDARGYCLIGDGADEICTLAELRQQQAPPTLHDIAWDGHADTAKVLIAAGADVNAKDSDGDTPLQLAAFRGHADLVKMLIAAGADA